jgi:tRNA-binding EMAP/Myf-like protein
MSSVTQFDSLYVETIDLEITRATVVVRSSEIHERISLLGQFVVYLCNLKPAKK